MPGDLASPNNFVQLVLRIAARDEAALSEFYDATSNLVYGVVKKILNNPSVAEEVTIDVYLQVWRQAERYSVVRGSPTTWLIMLARSRAIDSFRSSRRREALEHPIHDTAQFVD
ncbi:MAG: hypothetical protein H0X25_23170, partial [Acidobacteriales bacterium]|nr:hypothetical protein [Terriglobales bacterium]